MPFAFPSEQRSASPESPPDAGTMKAEGQRRIVFTVSMRLMCPFENRGGNQDHLLKFPFLFAEVCGYLGPA
jgi:hypothetical protein